MKDDQVTGVVILSILGIPALMFLSALFDGWALSILWKWFVVNTFNIQSITIAQAIGLSLIVGYMTRDYSTSKKEDHPWVTATIMAIMKPLLTLLIGWCITLFM